MLKPIRGKALLIIVFSFVLSACNLIQPKITKHQYDRVQTGMTLSEVQNIMGKPGETSAEISFNIPTVHNLPIEGQQAIYQWKNPDGSSMTTVFINDKLFLKNQINLK